MTTRGQLPWHVSQSEIWQSLEIKRRLASWQPAKYFPLIQWTYLSDIWWEQPRCCCTDSKYLGDTWQCFLFWLISTLTYWSMKKIYDILQKMSFSKNIPLLKIEFLIFGFWNFMDVCCKGFHWQEVSTGSGNGSVCWTDQTVNTIAVNELTPKGTKSSVAAGSTYQGSTLSTFHLPGIG